MGGADWIVFALYLAAMAGIGLATARGSGTTSAFFVADRSIPWWAVGLSAMATQMSAITLIGTTGLGYAQGLRFAQFYFGMPLALAILAFTLMPLYHRAGVYTAYELLGRRFDAKTRLLASAVFLVLRCLSLGVVIYAPSLVLALLLGWTLPSAVLLTALVAIAYTALGGIRAVIWTDVVQMLLILVGLGACLAALVARLPAGVAPADALRLADLTGHLRAIDLSFDPADRYTLWSGLLGGTFLFLAYFGCDQSQVQRFLAGRSLRDNRLALAFNAVFKVPVQLAVLACGVFLFVVFHFERPPLLYDDNARAAIAGAGSAAEYEALDTAYGEAWSARERAARAVLAAGGSGSTSPALAQDYRAADAALHAVRRDALALAAGAGSRYDDTNAVFPFFVLRYLPAGLAGLLVAAIFAAAMSSIDSEIGALASSSVVDHYQNWMRPGASDAHYVLVARVLTVVWGGAASAFALYAGALGSVIEAVNQVGSYFYGALLGAFALAYAVPRANGHGACAGMLVGMAAVALADARLELAWLWLNPIGCGTTLAVGWIVSLATRTRTPVAPRA